jgi:DNA repair exonuclease SbcCD ATPase subunit
MEYSRKGKVKIKWNCFSHLYNKDTEKTIIDAFSKKYNMPKNSIKVEPVLRMVDEEGNTISLQQDVLSKIQEPLFQQKLFNDYINMNGITDINIEKIIEIDNDINQNIDYNQYEKYGKIIVKQIEWSNFLSYGEDNKFDFRQLHGLVALSGEPSNQSGKTTFALSLLKFALYGTCDKAKTLDKLFNKHLNGATEVEVKLFIEINGQDFLIQRTVTRPKKRSEKSKAAQTVRYYKIINGLYDPDEPLTEYDAENQSGDVKETNKTIKECLCKEADFDLIASATSKNLDDIIFLGDTERGRLFSRWIGILPIQEKEAIAKDKWNKTINPKLLSNQYNTVDLQEKNVQLNVSVENSQKLITGYKVEFDKCENEIVTYNKDRDNILSTKGTVDPTLVKLDVQTQETKRANLITDGKNVRGEIEIFKAKYETLKDAVIDVDEKIIINNRQNILKLTGETATIKNEIKNLQNNNSVMEQSRICPTCKREYDTQTQEHINATILSNNNKITVLTEEGKTKNESKLKFETENVELEAKFKEQKQRVDDKTRTELNIAQKNAQIEKITNEYRAVDKLIKDFELNRETISNNNKIDLAIQNLDVRISTAKNIRDNYVRNISQEEKNIESYKKMSEDNEKIILKLYEESIYIKHYRLYLELMGKKGISSILINRVLPILNLNISQLLNDICDFNVEIILNDKNDLQFLLVQETENGETIKSDLAGASGFELSISALAIRSVLSKISAFTRLNMCLYDETFGRVSVENLPNIKKMLDIIVNDFQFIFIISHLDIIKDWCDQIVIVTKENRISKIKTNF